MSEPKVRDSRHQRYYEDWYHERRSHPTTWYARLTVAFYQSRAEAVFRLLDGGRTYLDIGCGDGALVQRALGKYEECYGVDLSQEALNQAEDRLRDYTDARVRLIQCNLDEEDLDFNDGTFDCVTCVATLEHLFDPIHALEEIIRVTRVGGSFVLNVPNIAYIKHRFRLLRGRRPRTSGKPGWDGGHLQYFTLHDFRHFFKKHGVAIVKVTGGAGRFMHFRGWWPTLLSADLVVKCKVPPSTSRVDI